MPSCAFAMVASPRALAFNSDDPVCIAPIRFLPPSEVMRLYASPCRVLTPLLHRKSALLSRSGRFVLAAVPALPCRASVGSTFVSTHVPSVSRVGSFRCIPSDGVSILSLPWPSLLAAPCFGQLFVCSTGDSAQFAVAAPRAPKLVPCSTSVGPVPWSAHVVAYASRILQSLALLLPTFSLILSSWFLLHGAQVLPRFSDGSASVHTAAADGSGLRPLALRSAMHCSCSSAPCSQHVLLGLSRASGLPLLALSDRSVGDVSTDVDVDYFLDVLPSELLPLVCLVCKPHCCGFSHACITSPLLSASCSS